MQTNNYLDLHARRRDEICRLLTDTAEHYTRTQDAARAATLQALSESVRNGLFSIVVVGEFSAGKSTFLNALMGQRLLPSFTGETTATVNLLRSVDRSPTLAPLIRVNYNDGTTREVEEVDLATIEKYVSTRGQDVAAKIKSVEVFLDSPFLLGGVMLVDSPGLNGLADGHEQITNEQIDQAHACIYMFRTWQPGTRTDFETLRRIRKRCGSLLIVLNGIDHIKAAEGETVESVKRKLIDEYHAQFPDDQLPEIWPVAALHALVARHPGPVEYNQRTEHTAPQNAAYLKASRIEEFEERLMKYLTQGEKTRRQLAEPVEKVCNMLQDTRRSTEQRLEQMRSGAGAEDAQKAIDILEQETRDLDRRVLEEGKATRGEVQRIVEAAVNAVKAGSGAIAAKYTAKIEKAEELEEFQDNAALYVRRVQSEFIHVYQDAVEGLAGDFSQALQNSFSRGVENLQADVADAVKADASLAKIDLGGETFELDVDLDDYNVERDKLVSELDALDEKQQQASRQLGEARAAQRNLDNIEKEMSNEREILRGRYANMGTRPATEKRYRTTQRERGGVWGSIHDWWSGRERYEETYYDDSAGKKYDEKAQRYEREYDERSAELQKEREAAVQKLQGLAPESAQEEIEMARRRKQRIEAELAAARQEKDEKVRKCKARKMRKARTMLIDKIDEFRDANETAVVRNIHESRNRLLQMADAVLRKNLTEVLEQKLRELDERRQSLNLEGEQRREKIEADEKALADVKELLARAVMLRQELEEQPIDTVGTAD